MSAPDQTSHAQSIANAIPLNLGQYIKLGSAIAGALSLTALLLGVRYARTASIVSVSAYLAGAAIDGLIRWNNGAILVVESK